MQHMTKGSDALHTRGTADVRLQKGEEQAFEDQDSEEEEREQTQQPPVGCDRLRPKRLLAILPAPISRCACDVVSQSSNGELVEGVHAAEEPFGPKLHGTPLAHTFLLNGRDAASGDSAPSDPTPRQLRRRVHNVAIPGEAGSSFTGEVRVASGRPHGNGVLTLADGTTYEGQWADGAAHGQGELRLPCGGGYNGDWNEGLKHGAGVECSSSTAHAPSAVIEDGRCSEYRGCFRDGLWEGIGSIAFADGACYEGEFIQGVFHRDGRLRWADEREYVGQWEAGALHGAGRLCWPDGRSHTGCFEANMMHGPGIHSWPDGSACKGRWERGQLHGSGTHVGPDGVGRHGRWDRGELAYWTD